MDLTKYNKNQLLRALLVESVMAHDLPADLSNWVRTSDGQGFMHDQSGYSVWTHSGMWILLNKGQQVPFGRFNFAVEAMEAAEVLMSSKVCEEAE